VDRIPRRPARRGRPRHAAGFDPDVHQHAGRDPERETEEGGRPR
jgi:hypothetical protein